MSQRVATIVRACAALALIGLLAAVPTIQSELADSAFSERARQFAASKLSRDSVRSGQWQLDTLDSERAWQYSTGAGVTVAVIDSGVAATHPDLKDQVLPGLDLVNPKGGDGTADEAGHGTTVAGLIAGRNDDSEGVVGLAPGVKILPVRVLDAKNEYKDPAVIAEAIVWAVDRGAKVVNLSLGSGTSSAELAEAVDYAFARDVVVVACVGNAIPNGPKRIWHPAREPGVLAVTALRPDGQLWQDSLTGAETVLAAPGSGLIGARPGGKYNEVAGTSFAAPLVSAAAALIRSQSPQLSAPNVIQRLISTARDEGAPGRDTQYGFGLVDPAAALTANPIMNVNANPLDTTPPPGKAAFGSAHGREPAAEPEAMSRVAGEAAPAAAAPTRHPSTGPIGLAAALAGFAMLAGGGITLVRRM